jgi:hypothetical protein
VVEVDERKPAAKPTNRSDKVLRVPQTINIPTKKRPGVERVWDRMYSHNERNKMMDKDESELSPNQKRQRKAAKATTKALRKRADQKREVVQGVIATDGVRLSQASAFVDGQEINGKTFCSQNAVKYFRNGYQSDSSEEEGDDK